MDLKKGITFHHYHISFAIIAVILLLVVLIFTIKPAMIGYQLNKEFGYLGTNAADFLREIDLFKSEILILETNLENYKQLNEDYLKQVTDEKNLTLSCIEEKRRLEFQFEQLKNEYQFNLTQLITERDQKKSEAELELNQLKIQFAEIKTTYETLVQNSANNICCKNKIDTPEIDSYTISNGKIVCTIGGDKEINC